MRDTVKRISARITALLMFLQLTAAVMVPIVALADSSDIIKSVTPSDGSTDVTNVGVNATSLIKIEFNEAMDPSTLDKDSVVVRRGTTVIMATHAKDIVDSMKKRVIQIEDGVITRDENRGGYDYEA